MRPEDRWWMRRPHTMGEKRAYEAAIEQGIQPRLARSLRNIVDAWDDIPLSRVRSKSWKDRRQAQYGPGVRLREPQR